MNRRWSRSLIGVAVLSLALATAACASGSTGAGGGGDRLKIGLIVKVYDNPFFQQIITAAKDKAAELGDVDVQTFAGKDYTDNQAQVEAVENLVATGADAIMIVATDTKAIVPSLKAAKDAGVLVVAIDSPLVPEDVADSTIATDNFEAGQLIGQWAKGSMQAQGNYDDAEVGLVLINESQIQLEVRRTEGFLDGFGVDLADPDVIGDETDKRIVASAGSDGNPDGARTAAENMLQKYPGIDLFYTTGEPIADGVQTAIAAAGKTGTVRVVTIDGSCNSMPQLQSGSLSANSMQFPSKMGALGVQSIYDHLVGGKPLEKYINSGVELITDQPVAGVPSQDTAWGTKNCF